MNERAYAEPADWSALSLFEVDALGSGAHRVLMHAGSETSGDALAWAERILLRCAQERAARSGT